MKLKRVTITGADDRVDHQALIDLSAEFPFVEWGILYSEKSEGNPRYPSFVWRGKLFFKGALCAQSLHLCGEWSRRALSGYSTWPGGLIYPRVQLNGFSSWKVPALRFADDFAKTTEIILQVQGEQALAHASALAAQHQNTVALWDQSGGIGLKISSCPKRDGLRMGYAGGIGPQNVTEVLNMLQSDTNAEWIDMESGVRTDDKLDLGKVRRVLELAKPFVVKA